MISHITAVYLVLLSASSTTATDPATRDAPIAAGQCSAEDAPCKEAKLDSLEMSIYCETLSGDISDTLLASLLRDPMAIADVDHDMGNCWEAIRPNSSRYHPAHEYDYGTLFRLLLRDLASGRQKCLKVLLRLVDSLSGAHYSEEMEDEAQRFLFDNAERLPALWGVVSPVYERFGQLGISLWCSDVQHLKAKVTLACASPQAPKDQCSALFEYFGRLRVECAENDHVPVVDAGASLRVDPPATKRPASQSPVN